MTGKQKLLSISEAAALLGRSPKTLRTWESSNLLPEELRPERDGKGERVYTLESVELIREWMEAHGLRSGMNLRRQAVAA